MSQGYRFFFSYARETYENAQWSRLGQTGNFLEEFFEDLCRKVSDVTGESRKSIAYRDQDRLKISDFWSPNLVNGLQQSQVLISILSPRYLKSVNCGREVEFFRRRFDKWRQNSSVQPESHRIIPVFWVDSIDCLRTVKRDIAKFIDGLQQKQKDTPDNYPAKGLAQFYSLGDINSYSALCWQLAHRIVDLSNDEPLPQLDGTEDFRNFPSAFDSDSVTIASGPSKTNVFYAIGTAQEMQSISCKEIQSYGIEPQDWKPFVSEHPGATIKLITEEGLNAAGQEEPHCNLGPPENLLEKIGIAQQRNSPVLIILDRDVLKLDRFKRAIQDYDEKNCYHVGLVTAGGTDIIDEVIAEICEFKFKRGEDHHIWAIPKNRESYVQSVTEVVRGLRKKLQQRGAPSINASSERKPELDISPVT